MLTILAFLWILRKLWWLFVLLVQIVGIVDIITSRLDKRTTILWIVVVLIFPLLGTALYFWLGGKGRARS